jgi:outer membrane protein assembly factor BamD (BamD/ComL family)
MATPKAPQLRLLLANVLVKENKYEQALSEIDTYLKENPTGADRPSASVTREQLIKALQR